jgi:hypothetical protein
MRWHCRQRTCFKQRLPGLCRLLLRLAICLIGVWSSLAGVPALGQGPGPEPLSLQQVVKMLDRHASQAKIESRVREKGINFEVTLGVEDDLKKNHAASNELISILREQGGKVPPKSSVETGKLGGTGAPGDQSAGARSASAPETHTGAAAKSAHTLPTSVPSSDTPRPTKIKHEAATSSANSKAVTPQSDLNEDIEKKAAAIENHGDTFLRNAINIKSCLETGCMHYTSELREIDHNHITQYLQSAKSKWREALSLSKDSERISRLQKKLSGGGYTCNNSPFTECYSNGTSESHIYGASSVANASDLEE